MYTLTEINELYGKSIMIIDNLNLNHLRIFECVFRTKSMTAASKELHLTQSGVSQHIKSLEDMLETKLFDRIKQKLVPTTAASSLFKECTQGLYQIENVLLDIKRGEKHITGILRIGMPIEFGKNVVMPLLAEFGKTYPLVEFRLQLGFAIEMNHKLLDGDIDFALVDEFSMDKRIETERVYDEILGLYIHKNLLKNKSDIKNSRRYYETLNYVEYQEDEPVLRRWFDYHLNARNISLSVKATVGDVRCVAKLILSEMGAGILPDHFIIELEKEAKHLYRFDGCGKALKNKISLAYLRERTHSPAVQSVVSFLKEKLINSK